MSKTTAEKQQEAQQAQMEVEINKAVGIMQNYGFLGLTRERLVKDTGAQNFFKGVLRQQNQTEAQIADIVKYLEDEEEKKTK